MRADVLVEAAQHALAAMNERHVRAQALENLGELDRDVAAADDHDPLGQTVQMERLVGGDGEFRAAHALRAHDPTAGGDEDPLGGDEPAAREPHLVRADDFGALLDDLRAGFQQVGAVNAGQPRDLVLHIVPQFGPVEPRPFHAPAEARSVLERLRELGGEHEQLFGDAAAHHAGPADPILLRDRRAFAHGRDEPGGAGAAGAGADGEEIVIILIHGAADFRIRCSISGAPRMGRARLKR